MLKWRISLVIGLALGLVLVFFAFAEMQRGAALAVCQRYVLGSGGADGGDCSDVNFPCKTIQYAINQAAGSDRICVAKHSVSGPLVYDESLTIGKSVYLDGAWEASCAPTHPSCTFSQIACDPGNVTIDALGTARVISIRGDIAPTIDCFTITGGDAAGMGGDPGTTVDNDAGGGIYSHEAAPVIINNIITANFGCNTCPAAYGRGGGIYLLKAPQSALIKGNLIMNNVADDSTWGQGGGIMLRDSGAQVISNTVRYNRAGHSAGYGGGIVVSGGAPLIDANRVEFNLAGQSVMGLGGGIFVVTSYPAVIQNNWVEYNQAINGAGDPLFVSRGGGLYYSGDPTVSGVILSNTIKHNIASPLTPQLGQGGGVFLSGFVNTSQVSGNSLIWNIAGHNVDGQGGGFYINNSSLTMTDNYVAENSATWAGALGEGGGFYISSGDVSLLGNTIFANSGAGFVGPPSSAIGYGGGVAAIKAQTTLENNSIGRNSATGGENWGRGGGVFSDDGEIILINNGITENVATVDQFGMGGGMYISGSLATAYGNLIEDNTATGYNGSISDSGKYGAGGGIATLSATGDFVGNTIRDNRGAAVDQGYGGGAYFESSQIWMDGNWVLANQASPSSSYGGGLRFVIGSNFTLTNNIIAGNVANLEGSGVAVLANSTGILVHNTIADHSGGDGVGVHVKTGGQVTLTNNIIANSIVGIVNLDSPASSASANYTLFDSNILDTFGVVANSNTVAGPAALSGDYHLTAASNAIDMAIPFAWIIWDIDGQIRPLLAGPDIGADEFGFPIYLPLLLK